jgi:uncharacterized protein YlzI (FlbEa/FlbD family)
MDPVVIATLQWIVLHGLNGREIVLNPNGITVMRGREDGRHIAPGGECAISMSDGKFVTVTETCDEVRAKIEAMEKPK